MYTIENDQLSVTINPLGAELSSVYNKENKCEYMWSGDAAFWGKKSPVLFPIVGTLKENAYLFNGNKYPLSRHGFAREKEFSVTAQTGNSISFTMEEDADTIKVFPFQFSFSLIYTLEENKLSVSYLVKNTGKETI